MKRYAHWKFAAGLLLLVITAFSWTFLHTLASRMNSWGALVQLCYYASMAAGLVLLGVARWEHGPLSALVSGAIILVFYTVVGAYEAIPARKAASFFSPSSLGLLLLGLNFLLGAVSAIRQKSLGKWNSKVVAGSTGLILFACMEQFIATAFTQRVLPAGELTPLFNAARMFLWLMGALLLPYLTKNRAGGTAMLTVGSVGLLIFLTLRPLFGRTAFTDSRFLDYMYRTVSPHVTIYIGFILGGCTACCRGKHEK